MTGTNVLLSGLVTGSFCCASVAISARARTAPAGRCEPLFSFGLVADIQYADKATHGARRYRESLGKLARCVAEWNEHRLAFVVQLGDIIDGNASPEATRRDLDNVLSVLGGLEAPMYHVIGNHCLSMPRSELLKRLHLDRGYYDFARGGWRFIVLDTMDVSVMGWPTSSPNYKAAEAYLKRHPKARRYNGGVGAEQKRWLVRRLAEAAGAGQHVVVFGHHPLVREASHADLLLWNHEQVAQILERAGCVVAYFCGHDHAGGYARRNGVHYVTLPGLVEAPRGGNAYATVGVYDDRLVIAGTGTVSNRTLWFDHPGRGRPSTTRTSQAWPAAVVR